MIEKIEKGLKWICELVYIPDTKENAIIILIFYIGISSIMLLNEFK